MGRRIGLAFGILLSTGMLVGGICWFMAVKGFASTAERAPGKVLRNIKKKNTYAPEFVFNSRDCARHIVVSDTSTYPASFSEGEAVTVLYDPMNPYGARIDSFTQLYLGPLAMAIAGGLISLILLAVGVSSLRKAATP